MAYCIDPARSTTVEVRRVLAEQLDGAAAELRRPGGPDAKGVHQARKHVKKARSLLRLARADLGPGLVRRVQGDLRRVAGELAGARDADSLVEVADELARAAATDDEAAAIATLRSVLAREADAARSAFGHDRATVASAALDLSRTATWLRRVPPHDEGWEALEQGFARQYRRGRQALGALGERPHPDELHDWRKRVKDLWYHERLLVALWPALVSAAVAEADELATTLGTDHDLGLLRALLDDKLAEGDGDGRRLVAAVIDRERDRLQDGARRLGARLYADAPDAWVGRHRAWWDAARLDAAVAAGEGGGTEPGEASGA